MQPFFIQRQSAVSLKIVQPTVGHRPWHTVFPCPFVEYHYSFSQRFVGALGGTTSTPGTSVSAASLLMLGRLAKNQNAFFSDYVGCLASFRHQPARGNGIDK